MSLGYLAIGTQQLSLPATEGPGYPWDERVPPPGRDATLLAVVPIPGTRTSLAIVGYAIRMSGELGPVHGQCLVTEHRAGYRFRPLTV